MKDLEKVFEKVPKTLKYFPNICFLCVFKEKEKRRQIEKMSVISPCRNYFTRSDKH